VGASGIAAPEAFLNGKMRAHLAQAGKSETEIFEMLRPGGIKKKVKKWPDDLLTAPFTISLGTLDPESVIGAVAEYIVRFHEAQGTRFPYWLFGWNYLNPRPDSCSSLGCRRGLAKSIPRRL
jgi:hypothetical protein